MSTKRGLALTYCGEFASLPRALRRVGNFVKTPKGWFMFLRGRWLAMKVDMTKMKFNPSTGEHVEYCILGGYDE